MGFFDRFRRGGEQVPDFEFRTVEQIREQYEFGIMGFLGFSTDWTDHCHELKIHEYPTLDFVKALAKYASERAPELLRGENRPLRVLEVAAGAGYTALGVRQQLDELHGGHGADVVDWRAVDSNAYGYPENVLRANDVAIGDFRDELRAYRPDMVFGGSIPHAEDEASWTKEFARAGIKEYLLTGYNEIRSTHEDDGLYMALAEDGYTQVVPDGFDGTQLSIRSDKSSAGGIIPNTGIISLRIDGAAS
ncbi:MAG TPA: hypothetical protein VFW77_01015 [Candidatus Saccharimonadales bacterium]|nr:hypothetical protein [Candidatus Saccharimonadales bacterium]